MPRSWGMPFVPENLRQRIESEEPEARGGQEQGWPCLLASVTATPLAGPRCTFPASEGRRVLREQGIPLLP